MKVTSYNKNGEEINTKNMVLDNENVYKILRKYIGSTKGDKIDTKEPVTV